LLSALVPWGLQVLAGDELAPLALDLERLEARIWGKFFPGCRGWGCRLAAVLNAHGAAQPRASTLSGEKHIATACR
jgi:hypothetical protein